MKRLLFISYTLLMFGWFVGCHRPNNRTENLEDSTAYDVGGSISSDKYTEDSFIVAYREPINGYRVKAIVRFANDVLSADLLFKRGDKQFTLHTTSFGDTCYNKGWWGYADKNIELYNLYKGKTIMANYPEPEGDWPRDVPFFFKDFDFDEKKELAIVHYTCAVRYHDEYDVYRIVEDQPLLLDYPPFRYEKEDNYALRMTDYPEYDYMAKTISCPYPEGELQYEGRIVYGVSMNIDKKVLNGKTYSFNRIEPQKESKFIWKEHGDLVGVIEYKYINGEKIMAQHDLNLDSVFINARKWNYYNQRFGFQVEYPSIMELFEAGNGDGATFTFHDIVFKAWGEHNIKIEALGDISVPKERSYYTPQSYVEEHFSDAKDVKIGKYYFPLLLVVNVK